MLFFVFTTVATKQSSQVSHILAVLSLPLITMLPGIDSATFMLATSSPPPKQIAMWFQEHQSYPIASACFRHNASVLALVWVSYDLNGAYTCTVIPVFRSSNLVAGLGVGANVSPAPVGLGVQTHTEGICWSHAVKSTLPPKKYSKSLLTGLAMNVSPASVEFQSRQFVALHWSPCLMHPFAYLSRAPGRP